MLCKDCLGFCAWIGRIPYPETQTKRPYELKTSFWALKRSARSGCGLCTFLAAEAEAKVTSEYILNPVYLQWRLPDVKGAVWWEYISLEIGNLDMAFAAYVTYGWQWLPCAKGGC
jgi:hypothetical protein